MLFALCSVAQAQQPTKVPRIGYLSGRGSSPPQEFVQALRKLGYEEGKNITIEHRSADSKRERVPDLAAELVRLKVDIIVAEGTNATSAAKKTTSTIPIVMAESTDPVGTGLVTSLARPGANVTGLTSVGGELGGKLLELLKEIVPRLSRVVIPGPPLGSLAEDFFIKETEIHCTRVETSVDTSFSEPSRGLRKRFSSGKQRRGARPLGTPTALCSFRSP